MSPGQARRERRQAERKARKAEIRRMKASAFVPAPEPVSCDLQEEFSPEFIAHVAAVRNRGHASLAHRADQPTLTPGLGQLGFVSQCSKPATEIRKDEAAVLSVPKTKTRREINRANAQHSTGPRSSTGKLASSCNSLKHGLSTGQLMMPGEDAAEFEALRESLLGEHQPAGPTEELLVNEMAQAYWLEQRVIRLQNECFTY